MKTEDVIEQFGERLRRLETAEVRPTMWEEFRWYGALNVPVPPTWILWHRIYNESGRDLTISKVFLSVYTAPTSTPVTVDVYVNGASLFAAPGDIPSILVGANTAQAAPTASDQWPAGGYLTAIMIAADTLGVGSDLNVQVVHHA